MDRARLRRSRERVNSDEYQDLRHRADLIVLIGARTVDEGIYWKR
jgi:hypothetical protein